jgi:hypothetical protein
VKVSDLLLMTERELSRLQVLQQLAERCPTQRATDARLAHSVRQLKRPIRAYKQSGVAGLVSK